MHNKLFMRLKTWGIAAFCIGLLPAGDACAQLKWNFGLAQKQRPEVLPKSEHSFQQAVRKPKVAQPGELERLTDWEYVLSKGWEMIEGYKARAAEQPVFAPDLDTRAWYNATVPGTVLTTLVDQGVYPDPYWGLNNLLIPDTLCRMDWWYRNSFEIPRSDKGKRVKLLLNGINYKAEVWFNHQLLGTMTGAFERGEFDITSLVAPGQKNVLAVHILPPNNPGIPHESNRIEGIGGNGGALCLDGPTFISSEGWDWIPGIRDRNIGIWQDVRICYGNDVELVDPHVITDLPLPDTTSVDFILRTQVRNLSPEPRRASLCLSVGDVSASYPLELKANESRMVELTRQECAELTMKHPRLWWPNGYGAPNLYDCTVSLTADGSGDTLDVKRMRIGIRELEYELAAYQGESPVVRLNYNPTAALRDGKSVFDAIKRKRVDKKVRYTNHDGEFVPALLKPLGSPGLEQTDDSLMKEYIVIKVNGRRIYCKGGNWGMDDGLKRVSRERLEPYLKLHKNMNYNMIRNWTGETTEEAFYELCDEYGMLVMNDFWLSTDNFNLNPLDNDLFMRNVTDVVRRFRNHPSIALWSARNEGFAKDELEHRLAATLAAEDRSRHYTSNSRSLNSSGSGPWRYMDPAWYYRTLAGGFRSEVGTHSLPTAETIREFMAPEDTWPISDVWYYHDWHNHKYGNKTFSELYVDGIEQKLGPSDNLDDFCRKAQLINYESHRAIFEAWNAKLWNDASGVLLWMSHPAWPSMVWQNYSSNGETAGAYYGAQKACRPLHVQMSLDKFQVDVVNASLKAYGRLKLRLDIYDRTGNKVRSSRFTLDDVAANCLTHVTKLDNQDSLPAFCWVKLTLTDAKGKPLDDNTYWLNRGKWNGTEVTSLPDVPLRAAVKRFSKQDGYWEGVAEVKNPGKQLAVAVVLGVRDGDSKKAVRPVYFDDGYFCLMPGESKRVTFRVDSERMPEQAVLQVEGYNVPTATLPLR